MKIKHILLGITIVLSSTLFGQVDRSIVPKPGPAPEINIADPVVFDLDNGMKVILSTNHKIPKVSFNLVMGSDPRLEGDKAGISDVLGQLLLSGTTNRTKDQLDEEKDFIGATLSASSNNIFLSVMTKHMDKGLDIMTDVMQNANFPQSEFDRIMKQNESAIALVKSDPGSMASNAVSKIIFTSSHPFGEITTEESLKNITKADVENLYKRQFTPSGSYLVIVGDIDEAGARKVANERFGSWEGRVPHIANYKVDESDHGNQVYFINKQGAVQSVINIAFPVNLTPGHEDQIKLDVANKIYGGHGFGARLMQNLREDKAYTYGAYSSLNINRDGSYISASGNFRNEVTDSAIVEFLAELERITIEPVTDEELSLAKASMAGSFARSLESSRTIANFAYSIFRNNLPEDYYQTYLQKLDAVTKDDILEMTQKYFKPNNLNIIVAGNKDEVLDKLVQFDSDGKVETLDAFGNPYEEADIVESDLTSEQIIHNYLMAITQTNSFEDATKKIDEIVTLKHEEKSEFSYMGQNIEQKTLKLYQAPNISYEKSEMMGQVVSEQIFTGKKGLIKTPNQLGGLDEIEMTEEQVLEARKTANIFPEFSLVCCHKDDLKVEGKTQKNGQTYYIVKYVSGESTMTDYYNAETFLKDLTEVSAETPQGPQFYEVNYSNYTDFSGYLFPKNSSRIMEAMGVSIDLKSTITNIEINGTIDKNLFKL
ncbi:MAG: pitrilysin family protein [Brumimicrobium sp.]